MPGDPPPPPDRAPDPHEPDSTPETRQRAVDDMADDLAAAGGLLLDAAEHAEAAGVDDEHPFGHLGRPFPVTSPLRLGFTLAFGALLAYEVAQLLLSARQVLILLVVSVVLAVGLDPAVSWLARWMRRGVAVTVVLCVLLGIVGGFVAAAAPPVAREATSLVKELPDDLDNLQRKNGTLGDLERRYHIVEELRKRSDKGVTFGINGVFGVGKAVLGALTSALSIFVLTAYILANLPDIKQFLLRLIPRSRRPRVGLLLDESLRRIGGYVLGNLATSLVAGLASLIFLFVADVPYAIALALFVAIMDLVPLIGATIAAVVVSVVALVDSVPIGIATVAFFAIYQQFENYILVPRVMSRTVAVSPLVTVLAALIGGTLLGVTGALLAVPVAAVVQVVVSEVLVPRQDAS